MLFLSCSLQISMTRCVILVVLVCACLLASQATEKAERTRYGYPDGFKKTKKYWMRGGRIVLSDFQVCRIHCTEGYVNCFNGKRCYMSKNEHRIKECKEKYEECLRRCLHTLERIKNNDFPDIPDN